AVVNECCRTNRAKRGAENGPARLCANVVVLRSTDGEVALFERIRQRKRETPLVHTGSISFRRDGELSLVDDDLAFFQHDLRLEHLVDVERRVAGDENDVGKLARLECPNLI